MDKATLLNMHYANRELFKRVVSDAMPKVVVRRVTRPDIPDTVGKNVEPTGCATR